MENKPMFYLTTQEFVLSAKDLTPQEKLLLILIQASINDNGYTDQTNKYFGEYFDIMPNTVSKQISNLSEKNYIFVLMNEGYKRLIFTPDSLLSIMMGKKKLDITIENSDLEIIKEFLLKTISSFIPLDKNATPPSEKMQPPHYILETNKETIISNKETNNSNKETQLELFEKESESSRKTSEKTRCLFVNSKFSNFDDFKTQFSEDSFKDIDLFYYYNAVKDWSSSKDKRMKDWIATARNFMRSDRNRNQLKVKVENVSENNNFKKFLQL